MARNETTTLRGRITTKFASVYAPHDTGVGFLITIDETGAQLVTTTCWSPDPIDIYEEGDVVQVTFQNGGATLYAVRRLLSVAFLSEIRIAAAAWLKAAIQATFSEARCGRDFQAEVIRLLAVADGLDVGLDVAAARANNLAGSLSDIQTLAGTLSRDSPLAVSHLMDEFLAFVSDAVEAITLSFAAAVRGEIDDERFDAASQHLKRVSAGLPRWPHFPKLREAVQS